MKTGDWELIQELFEAGLLLDGEQRLALLSQHVCSPEVRDEVEGLWRYSKDDPSQPDLDSVRRLALELLEEPEELVPQGLDRYKIIEPIGKGGMGVVYKAEQGYPVKRLVALKVLPLGSCSPERLQRFQAEQRALSLLDHPNVVSVYDSGETPEGQPYYVMAYLPSQPITVWCDENKLSIRDRLSLFIGACRGLAQAHRKGIIHRDINPNNVLTAMSEQGPVARIIDFGIARFTQPNQLEDPVRTAFGVMMGTPGYMSPEQAAGSGEEAVDTLSDIYGLGALLYELLTGVTPLGNAAQEADSLEELYRTTRNFLPPPPTQRLQPEMQPPEVASARNTTPGALEKTVRGELEWIVMKAIAHKAEDRYASCDDLTRDIERYLEGLPVEAGPVDRFYRIRKFIWFHRRAVVLTSAFLILLFTAVGFITSALWRALAAEKKTQQTLARLEAVQEFTQGIFSEVNPARSGREVTGYALLLKADRDLTQRYAQEPELEADTRMVLGSSFKGLGLLEEARNQFRRALSLRNKCLGSYHLQTLWAVEQLAFVEASLGDPGRARFLYSRAATAYGDQLGEEDLRTLRAAAGLAHALGRLGENEAALSGFSHALELQERVLGSQHEVVTATRHNYANLLLELGRLDEAESLMVQNQASMERGDQPDEVLALRILHNQAYLYQKRRFWDNAASLYRDVLERRRTILGPHHPESLHTLNNLAVTIGDGGGTEEAITLLGDALDEEDFPQTIHPTHLQMRHNLGHYLMASGDYQGAGEVLECVYLDRCHVLGRGHAGSLRTLWTITENKAAMGQADRNDFERVLNQAEKSLGTQHPDTRLYRAALQKM